MSALCSCHLLDSEEDKSIDYDISAIAKASLTKDGLLTKFVMSHKDKKIIIDCLNSIENDIKLSQFYLTKPLIEIKKNEIQFIENKLKEAEGFEEALNEKQIKSLKTNEVRFQIDLLNTNIILISNNITALNNQLNKLRMDLLP